MEEKGREERRGEEMKGKRKPFPFFSFLVFSEESAEVGKGKERREH